MVVVGGKIFEQQTGRKGTNDVICFEFFGSSGPLSNCFRGDVTWCGAEHYWKFGGYAANLPPERWISRVLAWNPLGRRRSGCPRTSWPSKFISYTRYRHLGNWQVLARDPDLWRGLMDDFCMFCARE